jgi:hypothetical protein
MDPFDRMTERLDSLYESVDAGEPIDHRQLEKQQALDIVEAGVHYARMTIEQVEEADRQSQARQDEADGAI